MTRRRDVLPTPGQIANTPELAMLATLQHGLELTLRAIIAAHPDLDDPDRPYWATEPSRTQHAAQRLLVQISLLQALTQEYVEAIELDRREEAARVGSRGLPF